MVYFFQIRGGQCQGRLSALHLRSEDICCYVGRDKHENEELLRYAWPGDIWFHVSDHSSAHVYFRLQNPEVVASSLASAVDSSSSSPLAASPAEFAIPIDALPADTVYDMMQICKDNSIAGSKLNSCKIVYTPHSNLKKSFDMAVGSVSYHNTKLCRYLWCQKDRKRVNELNKTKSADIQRDFYAEMKKNERRIVESRKQAARTARGDAKQESTPHESPHRRPTQGDAESGIDAGLEALERVSILPASVRGDTRVTQGTSEMVSMVETRPRWKQESDQRMAEPLSANLRFLLARGYTRTEGSAALVTCRSAVQALNRLYHEVHVGGSSGKRVDASVDGDPSNLQSARREEKEVLLAMYEFDEEAIFAHEDVEESLDVSLPVPTFEVPDRYYHEGDPPPTLRLEMYVDDESSPNYPLEPPVLAVLGGGFCQAQLRDLTSRLYREASSRIDEADGEPLPLAFVLLTYCGELANQLVQEEGEALELEQKATAEAAAAAIRREAHASTEKPAHTFKPKPNVGHTRNQSPPILPTEAVAIPVEMVMMPPQKPNPRDESTTTQGLATSR